MNELQLTARTPGGAPDYVPAEETGLRYAFAQLGGNGAPETPFVERLTVENPGANAWRGVLRVELPLSGAQPRFLLPGFLYGTNRGDAPLVADSQCPRLRANAPFPASGWWMTRADRMSHPIALALADGWIDGIAAPAYYQRRDGACVPHAAGQAGRPAQYGGFGCHVENGCLWYTLGYENAPWLFVDSHLYTERAPLGDNCFTLAAGERVTVELRRYRYAAADERGFHAAIRALYASEHEPPRRAATIGATVRDVATAIDHDAWLPDSSAYAGFVFDDGTTRALPSISWTNGLSVATPMLLAALRLRDDGMRAHAVRLIDDIAAHSINERSGLPYAMCEDGRWSNRGWWFDRAHIPGHPGYLVGQSAYLVLKAWEAERGAGRAHDGWLAFARRVVERLPGTVNGDGEFPYLLSEATGAGLEYDSMAGAWCLAAAAYLCLLTGERDLLPLLLRSEAHYHRAYVARCACYGGPLDIDKQIDSEGVLAYIRATRRLHELTGDPILLDHMRDALDYLFTFVFCWNSPVQTPPLSKLGWTSCGGCITSVTNPHIHPMTASIVDELLYFLRAREDAYVRARLTDLIGWCCQTYNTFDREYDYGKRGWMSERFCHSEGLLTERYPDGSPASTWFALMPWAGGCLLEGLCGDGWNIGGDASLPVAF